MKMCFFMVYLFSVVKRNKMSSFFFPTKFHCVTFSVFSIMVSSLIRT